MIVVDVNLNFIHFFIFFTCSVDLRLILVLFTIVLHNEGKFCNTQSNEVMYVNALLQQLHDYAYST